MNINRQTIFFLLSIIFFIVVFETSQQIFYVDYFNIAVKAEFWTLFKSQIIKWLVWFLMSSFLILFIKKLSLKEELVIFDFYKTIGIILLLILIDILIISAINSLQSENMFTWQLFWNDSFVYFSFQKFPIYTLAYVCLAITLYFYYSNLRLQIEVLEMEDLKKKNLELYSQIKKDSNQDQNTLLNIKVGNKHKVIPIDNIMWFEADDYCVNVYTKTSPVYSIRMSLKALEKKLPKNFIRVHRSAIVNMNLLCEFQMNGVNKITIEGGTEINVSQSKLKAVNKYLLMLSK